MSFSKPNAETGRQWSLIHAPFKMAGSLVRSETLRLKCVDGSQAADNCPNGYRMLHMEGCYEIRYPLLVLPNPVFRETSCKLQSTSNLWSQPRKEEHGSHFSGKRQVFRSTFHHHHYHHLLLLSLTLVASGDMQGYSYCTALLSKTVSSIVLLTNTKGLPQVLTARKTNKRRHAIIEPFYQFCIETQ